ncbi:regulatory protein, Fis family [Dethiosulfatibacter aminovorans DSM 17477]|uniref:Regulatory protein, Fis family n=1 Tax=Dethiosulfatibacter aminovorans DSM 17477 TaxID=1121476 RepID=A0A1M6A6T9_9FIRM|nr:sigma 54-interacting transcriptional regulator [Dethiosulfatibacter aminovorans]SHI32139.1 regulatory protein, Fis family [Dethiosulfatibacter aminovorans DSM 17477]
MNSDIKNDKTLEILLESMSIISKVTMGFVTVTDKDGYRIKTVDSEGKEIVELRGVFYRLACEAAFENKPKYGMSQIENGVEAWSIPVGEYVLCASNYERVKTYRELKNSLTESLPVIAKVVGGEAVLFDKGGTRIASFDSDGNESKAYLGNVSEAAKEAMTSQMPVIGDSNYIMGASAVRIPINKEFGFGFNNDDTMKKNQKLLSEVKKHQNAKYNFEDIIGESMEMRRAKEVAKLSAKSISSVLIIGETGTGKELFAQSIHNESNRKDQPFVAINCAAIPPNLMESSFFGYEKGSFTGAVKEGQQGVFEQANGGTLFLDEISEMQIDLQSKLLRVLQEREVKRIGGKTNIPLDIRIIAATNKDMDKLIKENKFRLDLYYRLNVIDIPIQPLRRIKDDIPLIVRNQIRRMNQSFGKFIQGIDDEALELLVNYKWPGNVRELVNVIEKAFNMSGNSRYITKEHLPSRFHSINISLSSDRTSLCEIMQEYEKRVITDILAKNNGSKIKTAEKLNISTTTLWRRIKELGISENEYIRE